MASPFGVCMSPSLPSPVRRASTHIIPYKGQHNMFGNLQEYIMLRPMSAIGVIWPVNRVRLSYRVVRPLVRLKLAPFTAAGASAF